MDSIIDRIANIISFRKKISREIPFAVLYALFQKILNLNNQVLDLIAGMGSKLGGNYVFDQQYIRSSCEQLADMVNKLIHNLDAMAPRKYSELFEVFREIQGEIEEELAGRLVIPKTDLTIPYRFVSRDFIDVVGAKNANLAEVGNLLGLAVPNGFAITTRAFQFFLEHNGLQQKVEKLATGCLNDDDGGQEAEAEIRDLIMTGIIPPPLAKALHKATGELLRDSEEKGPFFALRSSAGGEDTEMSFAGQYLSVLNIKRESLLHHYKAVLAGAYSAPAMSYRRQKGFSEGEVVMAVGCQFLIDASISGVLYTLDPRMPEREVMLLTATWGLGAPMLSGECKADQFTIARQKPHEIKSIEIVRKDKMLIPKEGGGTNFAPVEETLQTRSSLTDAQLTQIAQAGLMIEKHFKKPQDIEWAFDRQGRLFILQARPLNIKAQMAKMLNDISSRLKSYPILFENKGAVAQEGIGTGKVFLLKNEEALDDFPQGAVLVTRYTSPKLAKIIRKANAVITDIGTPTGHMATIAREFHVPTIVNTGIATRMLRHGHEITVDARQNVVYDGIVKELCYFEFTEEAFEEMYEYRLLRRVLKRIAPLNLLDPSSKNFTPASCRTFHDITRFVHEMAVQELIRLADVQKSQATGRKLKFDVPLDLVLIDIGGGLSATAETYTVAPQHILSLPMIAFLEGLSVPGAWNTDPVAVDFGGFMSSLTRTFVLAGPDHVPQNLAVISKEYANISLRLGYHFNMIDAYIGEKANDNYAYFRFLGGVTDITRRSRRARLLADILNSNDFRTEVRGDLVIARIKKLDMVGMQNKIYLLGLLVAYTRQLDIKMISEQELKNAIEDFNGLKKAHSRSVGL